MRRDLLALLVLLVSSSVAFAQGGQFFTQLGTTPATTKISADDVLARIMTFDQNTDGKVSIGELSERMRPLVERGDKDGDQALDRSEIAALSRAPSTQGGRGGFPAGGYSFGEDAGFSSRQHIEGALEDLRLTSDKTGRALPRILAYVEQVETAAKADLLSQMTPLLSPDQLWDFTQVLNTQSREVTVRANVDGAAATRTIRMRVNGDLAGRIGTMGLAGSEREQARKVIDEYKSRIRLGRESERSALLAQLNDVLSAAELDDFRAAIERRPVVASPFFGRLAFNDVVVNRPDIIDVARPAVLIERGSGAPIVISR